MAEVLRVLRDEAAPDVRALPLPPDLAGLEGLGPAAMNVGEIAGGSGVNVVPDRCAVHLERRVLPGEDPRRTMEAINALLKERLPHVRLEFDPPGAINYPMAVPEDAPIVRAVQSALRGRGLNAEPAGVTFGSDANRLAVGDIPCVVFGPGSISQAHTAGEWVDLREVALAARIMEEAAPEFVSAGIRQWS
jgi:acetylornithine deacetylase